MYPQGRALGWLPVASDGRGNYYMLAGDGSVGFIESINDEDCQKALFCGLKDRHGGRLTPIPVNAVTTWLRF
jgi:hypothetical protein